MGKNNNNKRRNLRAANSGTGQARGSSVPPIGLVVIGLLALAGWGWGNLVQMQTSEAFILGGGAIDLGFHWQLLMQPVDFLKGTLSPNMIKAATWAWGLNILLLICSVGIEHARIHHKHSGWFKTGAVVLLALNSWADFQYGSLGTGLWGQLAFAGMTLFMSFFFGLAGLHLIFAGLGRMKP